jgi:UDP-N-acetylmuramoyl-tripeptide--D-alanyl-D-alanine ligase
LNNHLGVPLTIFHLKGSEKICIFEVGINHKNEMKNLSNIIKPDIGIILNIAKSHLEYLINLDGVLEAKWELVENISQNGILVLNRDDEKLMSKLDKTQKTLQKKLDIILFGKKNNFDEFKKSKNKNKNENIYGEILKIAENLKSQKIKIIDNDKEYIFDFKILGDSGLYAALACFTICKKLDIDSEKIVKYLSKFDETSKMRFEIKNVGEISVIDDSYNANPTSMAESLKLFSKIQPFQKFEYFEYKDKIFEKNKNFKIKKIAVLGDMLELGQNSKKEHENIAEFIKNENLNIDYIFCFGKESFFIFQKLKEFGYKNIFWSNEKLDIIKNINEIIKKGDFLFLKGSRGMKLEEILENIVTKNKKKSLVKCRKN